VEAPAAGASRESAPVHQEQRCVDGVRQVRGVETDVIGERIQGRELTRDAELRELRMRRKVRDDVPYEFHELGENGIAAQLSLVH
jgi:hypothetical protein